MPCWTFPVPLQWGFLDQASQSLCCLLEGQQGWLVLISSITPATTESSPFSLRIEGLPTEMPTHRFKHMREQAPQENRQSGARKIY